jgi:uncharacterized protein YbcI
MPQITLTQESLAGVSDAISQILRRCYGKGPRRSRAYLAGDVLVVVLEGGFHDHEETFIHRGHGDLVRSVRQQFRELIGDELTAAVTEHTGLSVVDYVSAALPESRRTVEAFVVSSAGDADGDTVGADRRAMLR